LGDKLEIDGVEIRSGVDAVQFDQIIAPQSKTVTVWRNGLLVDYTLTVLFSEDIDSIRSIIDFRFNKAENPQIAATAVGSIVNNDNAGTINVQVFYSGARPSTLTAKFLSPGTVSVAGVTQAGGVSTQDFSQPLEYRVVSRNGFYARTYTVNVDFVDIANAAPRITSFMFSCNVNHILIEDAQAQISESAGLIMLSARYGGYVVPESLAPQFSATGLVTVAGTVQTSGYSAQNFSRQIKYTVTNPENPLLTRDYWVQVNFVRDTSSDANITAFGFHPDENPGLSGILTGAIAQDTITVYAMEGSGVHERVMVPRFTASGTVSVNGAVQSSGVSGLVFDAPVIYTVVSANGLNRRDYTVMVRELKPTIYVNKNATGSNDGLTWQDAFTDLRTACQAAAGLPADIVKEIWIAAGTYTPGPDTDYYFPIAPNTSYIGGFGGWENFKSQRNKAAYPVVISGNIAKGSARVNAAFMSENSIAGYVRFEDLEFRDFMQNQFPTGDTFEYYPLYTGFGNLTGENVFEVIGCSFYNVNNWCMELYQVKRLILRDIRADRIYTLINSAAGRTMEYVFLDTINISSQLGRQEQSFARGLFALELYSSSTLTISNITLQDCMGGFEMRTNNPGNITVNINNLKAKNMKDFSNTSISYRSIINIFDVDNVNISDVDIDGVAGNATELIFIFRVKINCILDNVSIKNAAPPYKTYGQVSVLNPGIVMIANTGYTIFNNCYFESSGTSPDRGYFICDYNGGGNMNLTIRNTRFNFKNSNPNLTAIGAFLGFDLENVTFENSVSNTLLSIDGNYPYRLKRAGSFYNGASLSDNAAFSALNARVERTGGAVLTGE
jgi:hypothetical protein